MNDKKHQKSWFSRNWLWFVPVSGCLGILLLLLFGIGTAIFGANKLFGESGPYEYAFNQAKNNTKVIELIGNSIEKGDSMQFNFSFDNDTGKKVDFKIPIEGSKSQGEIVVKATKEDGEWVYQKLYVKIKDSQERINLLDKALEGF